MSLDSRIARDERIVGEGKHLGNVGQEEIAIKAQQCIRHVSIHHCDVSQSKESATNIHAAPLGETHAPLRTKVRAPKAGWMGTRRSQEKENEEWAHNRNSEIRCARDPHGSARFSAVWRTLLIFSPRTHEEDSAQTVCGRPAEKGRNWLIHLQVGTHVSFLRSCERRTVKR